MITRRQFVIIGAGGLGVAAGALAFRRFLGGTNEPVVPLEWRNVPPGPLDDRELKVLIATVTAFFDVKSTVHYANMFTWRAEHLTGDRGVYLAFVAEMTRLSSGYANAERKTKLAALERGVFLSQRPEAAVFYSHVVDLIFMKYATTDAWLAQGYDAWPGMPRGFESYMARAPGDPKKS